MSSMTLHDVGRLAGVSKSTVSRVINDRGDVSPEVRARVLEVVAETGYAPNQAARSMAASRTDVIGLVIPSSVDHVFEDPYFGRLVRGITRAANRAGQTLALFVFADDQEQRDVYARVVARGLVEGLVLTATRADDAFAARLRHDDVTFVTVGRPDDPDVVHVDVDNVGGAALATSHLAGHGRTRIATVAGPQDTTTGVDRLTGHRSALTAAGLPTSDDLVAVGDFSRRGGRVAASRLLAAPHRPDALFCASDSMALGALDAVAAAGLTCPGDVAVAGFDGIVAADESTPALTTVAQPIAATGETAVELLLASIAGRPVDEPRHELATSLVVRASCGCHATSP